MLRPEIEQSLTVEFDQLFALQERLGQVADRVRAELWAAGLHHRFDVEIFDQELEMRSAEGGNLAIRLDSYRLEVTGAGPSLAVHRLAALILQEAEAYRLGSVEIGFATALSPGRGRPLQMVDLAFSPVGAQGAEPMLDRRISLTWDWGSATTGFSFHAADTEDRELYLSFKAREGYMTLPELEAGAWVAQQAERFEQISNRFLLQLGWQG